MLSSVGKHVKFYQNWYPIFVGTVILAIVANLMVMQYDLNWQKDTAKLINLAGRQRMYSQRITHLVLTIQRDFNETQQVNTAALDTLLPLIDAFEKVHFSLMEGGAAIGLSNHRSPAIKSLLESNTPFLKPIVTACRQLLANPTATTATNAAAVIETHELRFLLIMERTVNTFETETREKLGELKQLEFTLTAVSIIVLLLEFVLIFLPVIHSLKNTNASLTETNEALEVFADTLSHQNQQLSNFAHIISHNLRSPVSNLNSLLQFYQQADNDEEKKFIFAKFEKVIQHLSGTLNDLMEVLRVKEDSKKERERIVFDEVLNKILEILTGQIMEHDVSVVRDFSTAPEIEFNRGYLESIVLNLLTNAIKYRSPNRKPVITIRTYVKEEKTILSVHDNGLGIDLEQHGENLFGLHKTFHEHADARGIGLFITKTQIESMGGNISATSEVNKGTTFEITFNRKET